METSNRTQAGSSGPAPSSSWGENLNFGEAMRFWEPRRLLYSLILGVAVVIWIVASWPHFRVAFSFGNLLRLIGLGLIANAFYCAAYLVDIPLQLLASSAMRARWRWGLWLLGTLLALLIENYWIADEIYPFVR